MLPPSPRAMVSGWMPYWTAGLVARRRSRPTRRSSGTSLASGTRPRRASTIVDQLSDSPRADIVAAVHAKGGVVLGAVTDGTGAHNMAAILDNTTKRTTHVKALVALATSNNYDGIDLDYEGFAFSDGSSTWATTRPDWVAFVKELSAALHAKDLWLTVSVPVMYDSDRDGSSGYWVYDYAGIGPYVDRLRIMTYDYSVSAPGPIAPIAWVRRVLDYAVTQVPSTKIQVGVPAYGRDWPTTTAGCPVDNMPARDSYTSAEALAVAKDKGRPRSGTPRTWSAPSPTTRPTPARTPSVTRCRARSSARCGSRRTRPPSAARAWSASTSWPASRSGRSAARTPAVVADRGLRPEHQQGVTARRAVRRRHEERRHAQGARHAKRASGEPLVGEEWVLYWRPSGSTTWSERNRGVTSSTGTDVGGQAPADDRLLEAVGRWVVDALHRDDGGEQDARHLGRASPARGARGTRRAGRTTAAPRSPG